MTRLIALLLLLACVAMPDETAGQVRAFEHIDGPTPAEIGPDGAYVQAKPVAAFDTLRLWVQDVGNITRPNYTKAHEADVVVWCYPMQHPHDRHIFPSAKKVAVKGVHQGDRLFLLVIDLSRRDLPADGEYRSLFRQAVADR